MRTFTFSSIGLKASFQQRTFRVHSLRVLLRGVASFFELRVLLKLCWCCSIVEPMDCDEALDREMEVDPLQVATQARFAFVECPGGDLRWALPHDRECLHYKAQELVECVLQSLIETRMMLPQEDRKLAYLIGWVTRTLDQRDVLPMVAEDIANVFGALDFMWPHGEVWADFCSTPFEWNTPFYNRDGFEMSPGSVGGGLPPEMNSCGNRWTLPAQERCAAAAARGGVLSPRSLLRRRGGRPSAASLVRRIAALPAGTQKLSMR